MARTGRPFLLIAASDLKESDIKAFFMEIDELGVSACVKRIRQLRDAAENESDFDDSPASRSPYDAERLVQYESTIAKVRSLLLLEGGLTKTQAARALYSDIVKSGIPRSHVPPPQKVAFDLWVARLCDSLSPSEVLHIASRLRNDLVHGKRSPSSWPLLETDE